MSDSTPAAIKFFGKRFLTTGDLASKSGYSVQHIRRLLKTGALETDRKTTGGHVRFVATRKLMNFAQTRKSRVQQSILEHRAALRRRKEIGLHDPGPPPEAKSDREIASIERWAYQRVAEARVASHAEAHLLLREIPYMARLVNTLQSRVVQR